MNNLMKLYALVLALLPTRTLATITADLERKLGELDQHADRQRDAAARAEMDAAKLVSKAVNARADAARADRIARRLSDLIS